MKKFNYIHKLLYILLAGFVLTSCSDALGSLFGDGDGEISQGDAVQFTTLVPDNTQTTRSAKSEWEDKVKAYKAVNYGYNFKVTMYQKGVTEPLGSSTYTPESTTSVGSSAISNYDGTLVHNGTTPLYWPEINNEYGFKAETVSSSDIESDQNSQDEWIYQDKLTGYAYLPIWTGDDDNGNATDKLDEVNYRTAKQWYADNKTAKDLSGLMVESNDDYAKIPLYMQHQRAWLTIILKAGEGVQRDALKYSTAAENINMQINSYPEGKSDPLVIKGAWARQEYIDYDKDANGAAETNVSTTRYDAIVHPHNYATKKDEEIIAKIGLSNQNFSFYPSNDTRFSSSVQTELDEANNAYNLQAGKHLTIVATLSRESRKILITAWIEDWTELATATICDDYGQNGDPIVIQDRDQLIAFLNDPKKNTQGCVGIIQPSSLELDIAGEAWPSTYDLNATLNLAGCTLNTSHQLFNKMASSANLVNGTVNITDGAELACAIASENDGTIERVNVTTSGENSTAKATKAGMVAVNHGTIYQCNSDLTVSGSEGSAQGGTNYIGGIAAMSISSSTSSLAVIDGCTVNASVNGTNVSGGGIVGYATGRVSNNTYEYGITVSQDASRFKNIFGQAGNTDLRAYNNGWPTTVTNAINNDETNINVYTGNKFSAVLDCEEELDKIMSTSTLNVSGQTYRVSKSFSVSSDTWEHGTVASNDNSTSNVNNVSFTLDGNEKTITLTGTKQVKTTTGTNLDNGDATTYTTAPMLFNHILGEVKNLILYLDKPLVASPSTNINSEGNAVYSSVDAIAPLAYAVYGSSGKITNVRVKGDDNTYVQAATPAGLVVWAYGGATISECKVNIPVHMWLPESMGADARHYAGGIVACAAKATITQTQFLGDSESSITGASTSTSALKSSNYYYGGIVGGTSVKEGENPALQITDCSSWYLTTVPAESTDVTSKGGIIGFACYDGSGNTLPSGMDPDKASEGNWWQLSSKGACKYNEKLTEEKVIGKRNSVEPTYTTF